MTEQETYEYIAKHYPDSVLKANYELSKDSESDRIEQIMDFFQFEVLGMCGCGCPEESLEAVRRLLHAYAWRGDEFKANTLGEWQAMRKLMWVCEVGIEHVTDDPLWQFMAYQLDRAGLIEHGTSINGAWLTDLGQMCLDFLDNYLETEGGK